MNKHVNKNGGIPLTEKQRGEFAEAQLAIWKKRELRRSEHERLSQQENRQLDILGRRFAAELEVDLKKNVLNGDTYRFETRQVPLEKLPPVIEEV